MSTYTLNIKDYQIIKDATITFHQGLTLITGKSNHGKSSLLKALKQAIYNTPGTDFIRHNQPSTRIQLQYSDDKDSHNDYELVYHKSQQGAKCDITHSGNTEHYSKLGSSQLPQVQQITHIDKQLDYNFWNQLTQPFLIGLTPREQFDILQNSPHTQTLNNILKSMTTDRKQLSTTETQLQAQLQLIQQQSTQYQQQLTILPQIQHVYDQINQLQEQNSRLTQMTTLYHKYQSIDTSTLQQTLNNLQHLPDFTTLDDQFKHYQQVYTLYTKLQNTVKPINEKHYQIQQLTSKAESTRLFIQHNFPVCPLCNQPFNNHNTH